MLANEDGHEINYRNSSYFEFSRWIAEAAKQKNPRLNIALICTVTLKFDELDKKLLKSISLN